jgi:hypothetical protein
MKKIAFSISKKDLHENKKPERSGDSGPPELKVLMG